MGGEGGRGHTSSQPDQPSLALVIIGVTAVTDCFPIQVERFLQALFTLVYQTCEINQVVSVLAMGQP